MFLWLAFFTTRTIFKGDSIAREKTEGILLVVRGQACEAETSGERGRAFQKHDWRRERHSMSSEPRSAVKATPRKPIQEPSDDNQLMTIVQVCVALQFPNKAIGHFNSSYEKSAFSISYSRVDELDTFGKSNS